MTVFCLQYFTIKPVDLIYLVYLFYPYPIAAKVVTIIQLFFIFAPLDKEFPDFISGKF
jgi:hypothetical protein